MAEEIVLTPKERRQAEVDQYTLNISVYQDIIKTLPTEWPSHLEQYRGSQDKHRDIEFVEDMDDVLLLSKLWYADELKKLIRTEIVERTKAEAILSVL